LSYQLLKAAEEERRRLAAELHDSVGQSLSAAKYGVESALINLRASSDESSTKSLTAVVGIIQDVIDQIGRIQNQLRPATLDDLGLVATLEWVCREHRTIFDPTELVKNMAVGEEQVPETLKLPLYRIIREALNNVGKHASAGRIVLSLTRETDGLHLEIQDDGVGFDIEAARNETAGNRGLGLESMKERAELSGGRLEIRSQIGQGTVISGHWPL
jgi:signal transduction histidine kinase